MTREDIELVDEIQAIARDLAVLEQHVGPVPAIAEAWHSLQRISARLVAYLTTPTSLEPPSVH